MDYTQATPISDLDDLTEEMWDFWRDAVLSWGIWECWDGVNVIYIWDGHTLQGAREQTLLCSVMTPAKAVYLLIFKTCEYVT